MKFKHLLFAPILFVVGLFLAHCSKQKTEVLPTGTSKTEVSERGGPSCSVSVPMPPNCSITLTTTGDAFFCGSASLPEASCLSCTTSGNSLVEQCGGGVLTPNIPVDYFTTGTNSGSIRNTTAGQITVTVTINRAVAQTVTFAPFECKVWQFTPQSALGGCAFVII